MAWMNPGNSRLSERSEILRTPHIVIPFRYCNSRIGKTIEAESRLGVA
jgi:hypothetical protein